MKNETAALPQTPPLVYRARLSELDSCGLEVRCVCGCQKFLPFRQLIKQLGADRQIGEVTSRLRCKRCRQHPTTIHLCEPPSSAVLPAWNVQLYPPAIMH